MHDEPAFEQPEPQGVSAWVQAGVGLAFLGALLCWAFLEGVARFDPYLWYLNWAPGAYALTEFSGSGLTEFSGSGLSLPLILMFVVMGCGVAVAKNNALPAVVGVLASVMLMATSNAGVARWVALKTGSAQVTCVEPTSRACRLNDLNRRYDLRETVPLSAEASRIFVQYAALREQARVERPPEGEVVPLQMQRHQAELRKWEQRFKPELDALLGSTMREEAKG